MKPEHSRAVVLVVITLLVWALVGWMIYSLDAADAGDQMVSSTRLLSVLCAGAAVLLLGICIAIAQRLSRIAVDAEAANRFPPDSARGLGIKTQCNGEPAWMVAARLRGWSALLIAVGLVVALAGIVIAVRPLMQGGSVERSLPQFTPMPERGADPGFDYQPIPDRTTGAAR